MARFHFEERRIREDGLYLIDVFVPLTIHRLTKRLDGQDVRMVSLLP